MAQQTFEELVDAVKQAESRGKRYKDDGKTLTTSAKGALGEMQVMPKTIRDPGFGVTPAKDKSPDEIARVGVDYLQAMKQKYGDTEKALIAYNWGPGSTDKWIAAGADPKKLPAETRTYVERVKGFLGKDVPRETSVAKKEREPLPPSLPPMAQAPSVKPEAAARVASLGPGYQAALALSFLAETDDEEDRKTTITQEYLAKAQEEEDEQAATAAIAKRQANVFADLSNTTIRSPFAEPQQPVRMKDGGEVEQERLTPQQIERIAAQGPTERKDEPFFDAASRTYVDVLTGRREPITAKDFTAKEQMAMMDAVRRSQARGGKGRVDYEDYPDSNTVGPGYVDIRNTLGGFQYKQGLDGSTIITDKYDFHGPRVAEYEKMGSGEKLVKSAKNALMEFVGKGFSPRDLAGELGRAYVGSKGPEVNIRIPVGRAKGSPEEGEVAPRLTMQQIERLAAQEAAEREAASTPAFIAQKSGIGRKAGNISNALNSGTAYPAIAAGAMDLPYDLAGLPVDLTTMAMRPFGYSDQKPVFGSEYFKDLATEAGIRRPTPTDPTLKGFHTFGQVGAGVLAPGKIIQGAQALKGAAAEALAGFKAGRAERPGGMTDLMTGQRFEVTPLTPEQQAAEQLAINAVFDNMAGVNQRQIAADVAAGRLPQSLAPVPALLEAEQNIARLPADAQEQLRLFQQNAVPRTVAERAPTAQLPVATPVAPPVTVPVSAEFPFVGRLDEFAASMKGPAQKEQLINQVKSKFRDQDVARLEAALVGLGPKDKVTPAMLQEALANTYSPSRYRSAELPSTGSMYDKSDNVFAQNKPIAGSMNLYLKEPPEMLANINEIAIVKKELTDVLYGFPRPEKIKNINEVLAKSPLAVRVPEFVMLQQRLQDALPTVTRFGKIGDELDEARKLISFPLSYNKDGFNYWRELDRRVDAATAGMPSGQPKQIAANNFRITEEPKLVQELMQKGSDKLVALGGQPIDVTGYMTRNGFLEPMPIGPGGVIQPRTQSVANRAFDDDVLQKELKDISTPIEKGVKSALEKIQQSLRPDFRKLEEALQPFTGYGGRHRQATGGDNMPIGFSRFTEHTVDIDGKQLKGRHVHELQSDLSKDMKTLGPKGGSLEKDQKELDSLLDKQTKLMQESSDLTARFVGMPDTDPLLQKTKSSLSALDAEIKKIDQRKKLLKARITPPRAGDPVIGKYFLEEPFANFETNSPVRMQLLIKNAIQSSIRAGQDFVTFPGKESDKPKLYEKLLPNLKQAVKDLGGEKAGFEIKPITLPNPGGTEPTVWGVIWSPDTAAKAIEKGVPFNKGGMVERQPNDNRRYL